MFQNIPFSKYLDRELIRKKRETRFYNSETANYYNVNQKCEPFINEMRVKWWLLGPRRDREFPGKRLLQVCFQKKWRVHGPLPQFVGGPALAFCSHNFSDALRSNSWRKGTAKYFWFLEYFFVWKLHFLLYLVLL